MERYQKMEKIGEGTYGTCVGEDRAMLSLPCLTDQDRQKLTFHCTFIYRRGVQGQGPSNWRNFGPEKDQIRGRR